MDSNPYGGPVVELPAEVPSRFTPPPAVMVALSMLASLIFAKYGIDTKQVSEVIQNTDGTIVNKFNEWHTVVMTVVLAILNGQVVTFANSTNKAKQAMAEASAAHSRAIEAQSRERSIKLQYEMQQRTMGGPVPPAL